MIDIAFSKLAIIGVAALVFIGPEKLPKVARMAGTLFGRVQRYIAEVKSEVSREMELDELRKMHQDVKEAASSFEQSVTSTISSTENAIHTSWSDLDELGNNPLVEPPTPDQLSIKAKDFRKKRLSHTSGIPSWYKRQSGHRSRIMSGAARVAKHTPAAVRKPRASFYS